MRIAIFDHLVEILLHVFEYEIQRIVLSDDLLELYYVRMRQFLQRLQRLDGLKSD